MIAVILMCKEKLNNAQAFTAHFSITKPIKFVPTLRLKDLQPASLILKIFLHGCSYLALLLKLQTCAAKPFKYH